MSCPAKQQALTRNRYDDFHQVDDNRISTYAGRYALNVPAARCPTVFPADPTIRLQYSGDAWVAGQWRTDVESDLRGVDRFGSRIRADPRPNEQRYGSEGYKGCQETLYNPATNVMNTKPLDNAPDESIPMTFARLVDPPCTLRATGWNRFTPLFHNPQETFETPFDHYIPSRLLDKERYNTHKGTADILGMGE
jgi:hypothetical protein